MTAVTCQSFDTIPVSDRDINAKLKVFSLNKILRALKKVYFLFTGYDRERIAVFRGARFYARCSDHIGKRLLLDGSYEPIEIDYLLSITGRQQFDVFLDIGACFGLYSQVIAANTQIPTLHAFEPDSQNARLLERISQLNGTNDRIRLWKYGVSDVDSTAVMRRQADCVGNSSIIAAADQGSGEGDSTVELICLDDRLDYADKKLLIKMDVENHERYALKGMASLLRNNHVFLQVEIFDDNFPLVDDFLRQVGLRQVKRIRTNYYYSNLDAFPSA